MGSDSSTLKSVESLNETLEDIEKKLFVIEDVHLHHERTIAHDDSIIISGKKIECRSGVQLVCGPIVGTVGSDFVRLMVEADTDTEVTFNVFMTDESFICTRFHSKETLFAKKDTPVAKTVRNLEPQTNYTIYVGGISSLQAVSDYVTVQTLPKDPQEIRMFFSYNARVDRILPGESSLWREVGNRIAAPELGTSSGNIYTKVSDYNRCRQDSAGKGNDPLSTVHLMIHQGNLVSVESIIRSRAVLLLDLITREDADFESWLDIMHELERLVKQQYRAAFCSEALRKVVRCCGNVFLAGAAEAGVVTTALLAMNLPAPVGSDRDGTRGGGSSRADGASQSPTARSAAPSNVSVGVGETTTTAAAAGRALSGPESAMNSPMSTARSTGPGRKFRRSKEQPDPEGIMLSKHMRARPEAERDRSEEEELLLAPAVGGAVRRFYEAEQVGVRSRASLQDMLRKMLAGVIIRTLKRINHSYFRQLWDEDYEEIVAADLEMEEYFRKILRYQKHLQVKLYMQNVLEGSRARMLKEFGESNEAIRHLERRCSAAKDEIASLETTLKAVAVRCGEAVEAAKPVPNGACLPLGCLCLLLVEASWGWLGPDGQLLYPPHRDIEINEEIQDKLEQLLLPPPPPVLEDETSEAQSVHAPAEDGAKGAVSPALRKTDSSHPASTTAVESAADPAAADGPRQQDSQPIRPRVPITAVVCATTCTLLPCNSSLEPLAGAGRSAWDLMGGVTARPGALRGVDDNEPQMFQLGALDARRVLQLLARWQQESPDRAVLLAAPGSGAGLTDAAEGFAAPYAVDESGREIQHDRQFDDPRNTKLDVWDRQRSRLQQILLGEMDRRSRTRLGRLEEIALLQEEAELAAAEAHAQGEAAEATAEAAKQQQQRKGFSSDTARTDASSVVGADRAVTAAAMDITVDRPTQFKSIYDRRTRCGRRCFWDVRFVPLTLPRALPPSPETLSGAQGVHPGSPAVFRTACVTDAHYALHVVVGPLVGAVTATSAVVLIELRDTCPVELLCVDQLTGTEYLCCRLARAGRPCGFLFEQLQPNHAYHVTVPSAPDAHSTGSMSSTGAASSRNSSGSRRPQGRNGGVIWASFTTLEASSYMAVSPHLAGPSMDMGGGGMAGLQSQDGWPALGPGPSMGTDLAPAPAASDSRVVEALRAGVNPEAVTGLASGSIGGVTDLHSSKLKLLVLGADRPSWRRILPSPVAATVAAAAAAVGGGSGSGGGTMVEKLDSLGLGSDREQLSKGIALAREVANVVSQAWSGVDVVIHCGHSVDWGATMDTAVSLLAQAESIRLRVLGTAAHWHLVQEFQQTSGGSSTATATAGGAGAGAAEASDRLVAADDMTAKDPRLSSVRRLLLEAEEQLRGAFRFHWGVASHARMLLAHGSHYFVTSPMFDLLSVFQAASLRVLRRDLSPFCVQHLLLFMDALQQEYMVQLVAPDAGLPIHGGGASSGPARSSPRYLQLLDGGSTALFELQPNLAFRADSLHRIGDGLLSEEQLAALSTLLFPGMAYRGTSMGMGLAANSVSSAAEVAAMAQLVRANPGSRLQTLVLLTPLPLVLDEEMPMDFTLLTDSQRGVRYPQREVLLLLDLLTAWMESSPAEREVIIVAGGVTSSFTTTIRAERTAAPGGRAADLHQSSQQLRQEDNSFAPRHQSHHPRHSAHRSAGGAAPGMPMMGSALDNSQSIMSDPGGMHQLPPLSETSATEGEGVRVDTRTSAPAASAAGLSQQRQQQQQQQQQPAGVHVPMFESTMSATDAALPGPAAGPNPGPMHERALVHPGEGAHKWDAPPTKPVTLKLTQLCCGPLVGLFEDATPAARSGTLYGAARRYSYSHQPSSSSAPHCGMLEIPTAAARMHFSHTGGGDHSAQQQQLSQDGSSAAGRSARSSDPHGEGSGDLGEWGEVQHGLRASVQLLDQSQLVEVGLAKPKGPRTPTVGRARLQSVPVMQQLVAQLCEDISRSASAGPPSGNTSSSKKEKQQPQGGKGTNDARQDKDPYVYQIRRAVGVVCKQEQEVLEECHFIYKQHNTFVLPTSGGSGVEQGLVAAAGWIVQRMGPAARRICKPPTPAVVRLVWEQMLATHMSRGGSQPAAQQGRQGAGRAGAGGSGSGGGGGGVVGVEGYSVEQYARASEAISASLDADKIYFAGFMRRCIEAQLLVEYRAYAEGLLDLRDF